MLPYKPTDRGYTKDGCYCAIGWQLHCAGKSDQDLLDCNFDLIPDRVYHDPKANIKEFNGRLMEVYSVNDVDQEGTGPTERYEAAFRMSEQLKEEMPIEWALFVSCFNGIPDDINPELIDEA